MPAQIDWSPQNVTVPVGMQPPQTEVGHSVQEILPKESEEALFQLVLPSAHRETALKGCPNEVGHVGLECMLDLMHDFFFWAHMAAQAK